MKCFQDFCFLISYTYSALLNGSALSPQRLKTCENVTLENIWKQKWNVDLKEFRNIHLKCFQDFCFLISSTYSALLNGSVLPPQRLKTCKNVTLENIWKQNWNVDLKKIRNIDLKCFQDFCFLISYSYSALLNGSAISPQRLKTCENVTLENIWKQNWNVDLKKIINIDVKCFQDFVF